MNNYTQYLNRMHSSTYKTTKSLIPLLVNSFGIRNPHILDVGVGSGTVSKLIRQTLPEAIIDGVDIVIVEENLHLTKDVYSNLYCKNFFELKDKPVYDIIIFSSVIHEIGSYNNNPKIAPRYSLTILDKIFEKAYNLLKDGGHIIIRDGLMEPEEVCNNSIKCYFKKASNLTLFLRFYEQFIDGEENKCLKCLGDERFREDAPLEIVKSNVLFGNTFEVTCPRWMLREFLHTATWGEESWHREIKERFCYASAEEYISKLEKFFTVKHTVYSQEEYDKYFKEIVPLIEEPMFPIIGLFVAQKVPGKKE